MKRKAMQQGMFTVCRYRFLGAHVVVRPPLSRLYQSYRNVLDDIRRGVQSDEQEIGGIMDVSTLPIQQGGDIVVSLRQLPVIDSVLAAWPLVGGA